MYKFIDVSEAQASAPLPSEALKINGKYIEDEVPGYRTLYVKGREALSPDIDVIDIASRDGSRLKNRRYPARIITIGYQLKASGIKAFREAYNKLGAVLNVEGAELIFNDEPDKFFIGTPSKIREVTEGRLAIESEIEITCFDPFKYSIAEYTAKPSSDTDEIAVHYDGAYLSRPKLIAKPKSDLGFVCFISSMGKVVQIGDSKELNGVNNEMSETLIANQFDALSNDWKLNTGKIIDFTVGAHTVSTMQTGTAGIAEDKPGKKLVTATSYGTPNVFGGPSITREIPQDKSGHKGAKNFTLSIDHAFSVTDASQLGAVQFIVNGLVNGQKKAIAGACYNKTDFNTKASGWLYMNGREVKSYIPVDDIKESKNQNHKRVEISKFGSVVSFNFEGQKFEFGDVELANAEATEICIFFVSNKGYTPIANNGVYSVRFTSHSVESYADVPNKFCGGDIISADCRDASIEVNGLVNQGLGALGNDWEEFILTPGENIFACTYSKWATSKPEFEIKYREAWL